MVLTEIPFFDQYHVDSKDRDMKYHTKTGKVDNTLIHLITGVLNKDERVVFAYLYGSTSKGEDARDVDIAVYSREGIDPYELSSDLKVSLHFATGFPP